MWAILGMACALALAAFALLRSRRNGGFYDTDVYAMTPQSHRRYAVVCALFFVAFSIFALLRAQSASIATFAAFVLVAVFYLTSFLRGFSDDQE